MGLGELRQALVGLTSEDSEGQAEEEQGSCRGNSRQKGKAREGCEVPSLLSVLPQGCSRVDSVIPCPKPENLHPGGHTCQSGHSLQRRHSFSFLHSQLS